LVFVRVAPKAALDYAVLLRAIQASNVYINMRVGDMARIEALAKRLAHRLGHPSGELRETTNSTTMKHISRKNGTAVRAM
jgi:hypothetical protein